MATTAQEASPASKDLNISAKVAQGLIITSWPYHCLAASCINEPVSP